MLFVIQFDISVREINVFVRKVTEGRPREDCWPTSIGNLWYESDQSNENGQVKLSFGVR